MNRETRLLLSAIYIRYRMSLILHGQRNTNLLAAKAGELLMFWRGDLLKEVIGLSDAGNTWIGETLINFDFKLQMGVS